jgi:hypothetical protein
MERASGRIVRARFVKSNVVSQGALSCPYLILHFQVNAVME